MSKRTKSNAKPDTSKKTNKSDFSQFAWRKSIIVSNALMRAARFDALADGHDHEGFWATTEPIVESYEKSPTGLKGEKTEEKAAISESNLTIAAGKYPMIPPGCDAVAIRFEIKVVNATDFPQSAKLETWNKLCRSRIIVNDQEMSLHEALRCRAHDIFRLVAQQVFSGSWGWRNDAEALDRRISVVSTDGDVVHDANELANAMNDAFIHRKPNAWQVLGVFRMGFGESMRAYPSQRFIDTGSKDAEFYMIPGTQDFGMRSVKIGNRLKTIDTWYSRYPNFGIAIPVEPLGYFHALRANMRNDEETAVRIMQNAVSESPNRWDDNTTLYMNAITLFGGLLTSQDNERIEAGASPAGASVTTGADQGHDDTPTAEQDMFAGA